MTFRTPSQSFYLKGSNHKTPEKIIRVTGNSGVKFTPISKSANRIKTDFIETIQRKTQEESMNFYPNRELEHQEQMIQILQQQIAQQTESYQTQQQSSQRERNLLENRVLQLLNDNYTTKNRLQCFQRENEQLKQMIYDQQAKIIQQNQEIEQMKRKMTAKHCSFSEYFQKSDL